MKFQQGDTLKKLELGDTFYDCDYNNKRFITTIHTGTKINGVDIVILAIDDNKGDRYIRNSRNYLKFYYRIVLTEKVYKI